MKHKLLRKDSYLFPVLYRYSPNELWTCIFSRLFNLLDPDPGGISLRGSVSETLVYGTGNDLFYKFWNFKFFQDFKGLFK